MSKEEKIPVVLIHQGYEDYVGYAIKQASKNNPVHLIGDTKPPFEMEFSDIKNYWSDRCDDFRSNYKHLNTTPIQYEIFCFHRWFILKNFMEKRNLDVVFYIDSDVLLFVDVSKEWKIFNQFIMTLLHRTAAISSFITYEGICKVCNLIEGVYKNKELYPYKKIASHYHVRRECGLGGGVCDMTLLEYFHYNVDVGGGPGRVGEMMQIINDSTYDHNINVPDQDFAFRNNRKDVKVIDKIPYVYNERLKKDIKFNALHFQGGAKGLMKNVYEQCN